MRDTSYKDVKILYPVQEKLYCAVFSNTKFARNVCKRAIYPWNCIATNCRRKRKFQFALHKIFETVFFVSFQFYQYFIFITPWCGSFFYLPVLCFASKQRLLQRKKHQNIIAFLQVRFRFFSSLILKGLRPGDTIMKGLLLKVLQERWGFNWKAHWVGKIIKSELRQRNVRLINKCSTWSTIIFPHWNNDVSAFRR